MTDRIKLAHALGDGVNVALFDPFTDANDDYAVLEWLQDGRLDGVRHGVLGAEMFCYQIGDYARAALKVLDK